MRLAPCQSVAMNGRWMPPLNSRFPPPQILGDAYGCVLVDHLLQRRPRGGGSGGPGGSKQIPYVQLELGEAAPAAAGR